MAQATRIVAFACLCTAVACTHARNNEIIIESFSHMNQTKPNAFHATDKTGLPLVIEWQKTTLVDPAFAQAMQEAWVVARPAYLTVEMQFLKAFPAVVGKEPYFKAFEPLFADGTPHVDWAAAEGIMESILRGHFIFDPAQFSDSIIKSYADTTVFFVTARNKTSGQLLGFISFLIKVDSTKVMAFAVEPTHQKRGIGKLLMGSIFSIMPSFKKLTLCTRMTNTTALNAYNNWGFVVDQNPVLDHAFNLDHWIFLKYEAPGVKTLQKAASNLKG